MIGCYNRRNNKIRVGESMNIPEPILSIMKRLEPHYQVYLVGGFVRDAVWGKESFDVDMCTDAPVQECAQIFKDLRPSIYEPYGIKFKHNEYDIEISILRKETGTQDLRHPEIMEAVDSIEIDAKRRDFTINTLYCDSEGLIHDPLAVMNDVLGYRLKFVDDPYTRIQEDALRILRFYRFIAQHNLHYDRESYKVCNKNIDLLNKLTLRQMRDEFIKLLMAEGFQELVLEASWLLSEIFDEYRLAYHFDQKNSYHQYSLYEHSIRVVGACPYDESIRLAALFHDLGKLETQVIEDGQGRYPNHAKVSAAIAQRYLIEMEVPKKQRLFIVSLIENHTLRFERTISHFQHLIRKHGEVWVRSLLALKRADNASKSSKASYQLDNCDEFDGIVNTIIKENYPVSVQDINASSEKILELGIKKELLSKVKEDILDRLIDGLLENNEKAILSYCKEAWL